MNYAALNKILYIVLLLFTTDVLAFEKKAPSYHFQQINQPKDLNVKGQNSLVQDHTGFIWRNSNNQVYRFDSQEWKNLNQIVNIPDNHFQNITGVKVDSEGSVWIIDTKNKISIYDKQRLYQPEWLNQMIDHSIIDVIFSETFLYVVSQKGMLTVDGSVVKLYPWPDFFSKKNTKFKTIKPHGDNIYFLTKKNILSFNTTEKHFIDITLKQGNNSIFFRDLHIDDQNTIWLATDEGVYQYDLVNGWLELNTTPKLNIVKSIASINNKLWFATALDGLWTYDRKSNHLSPNIKENNLPLELSFVTRTGESQIWVVSFDGKLFTLNSEHSKQINQSVCFGEKNPYDIYIDKTIWLAAFQDKVVWKTPQTECQSINTLSSGASNISIGFIPTVIAPAGKHRFWLGSDQGLYFLNIEEKKINPIHLHNQIFVTQVIEKVSEAWLFVGTSTHGYFLNLNSQQTPIKILKNHNIRTAITINDALFIGTDRGLYKYSLESKTILPVNIVNKNLNITSMVFIGNEVMLSTADKALFLINVNSHEIEKLNPIHEINHGISNLVNIDERYVWILSGNQFFKFDFKTGSFNRTQKRLFDENNVFRSKAAAIEGETVWLGTQHGLVSYPVDTFNQQATPAPLVFTSIKRFNTEVKLKHRQSTNTEFSIPSSISLKPDIHLSHKDDVISFGFAALNFNKPNNVSYRYRLIPLDTQWYVSDSKVREATYTTLPSGNYTFEVQATDLDGNWSTKESLKITVSPSPWNTVWAWILYGMLIFLSVIFYIKNKTRKAVATAQVLKAEVRKKTNQLEKEKDKVEKVLKEKNALFAHVTHEFKTPLTLILNPIKALITQADDTKGGGKNQLLMIERNATRLLLLVEQLLQLAKISGGEHVKTSPQEIQHQVQAVFDSFEQVAKAKNIKYQLKNNHRAVINVTDQFIDVTLGNLISNALKYTPSEGSVSVEAVIKDNFLQICVQDTGCGLEPSQIQEIFKRFNRLGSHTHIEGIGIGLSIVKDVTEVNHGKINVISQKGHGSKFIIEMPLSKVKTIKPMTSNHSLVNQLNKIEGVPRKQQAVKNELIETKASTILIIEDNPDMRELIARTVSVHANTLLASNGKEGVEIATKEVPDLIICDVMMPIMDGYMVSRNIRNDSRTSHIPLILLTALNSKESRIQGWKENIDSYMTKPFDPDELLIRIENMITIRNILRENESFAIEQGLKPSGLTELDQQFIDKLNDVIQSHYQNPLLNRSQIAKLLAVSERQLQRKLKAIINQNPMDLLRSHRLKEAAKQLNKGYQVGLVADQCGFNSMSYFSQCFKAKYGLTPKKYQQQK